MGYKCNFPAKGKSTLGMRWDVLRACRQGVKVLIVTNM